jgi:PKD repeat protein
MTASPTNICIGDTVCFNLACDTFQWCHCSFKDGVDMDTYSPTFCHVYGDTGIFHPCCIAYNDSCASDTFCFTIKVNPPIARFFDSIFCAKGDTVFLYNKSLGATSYLWSFCNNTTSTLQNPFIVLQPCDTCSVTLFTHDSISGCDHQRTRLLFAPCDSLSFSPNDTSGCAPFRVLFQNTSPNVLGTFVLWDYDCSNGVTGVNSPGHVFSAPGTYCVAMRSFQSAGCRDTVYGTVQVREVSSNFSFAQTGDTIQFTNLSWGSYQTVSWNFGDSTSSSVENAEHLYPQSGTYFVTLTVTDTTGPCTDAFSQTITITHPLSIPDLEETHTIHIIPNPFNDYTLLKIEGGNIFNAAIRVADILGNIVRVLTTDEQGTAKIERENLAAGLYIYEVRMKGKRIGNGKMIVE